MHKVYVRPLRTKSSVHLKLQNSVGHLSRRHNTQLDLMSKHFCTRSTSNKPSFKIFQKERVNVYKTVDAENISLHDKTPTFEAALGLGKDVT